MLVEKFTFEVSVSHSKAARPTVYQKHSTVLRLKAYVYSATLARCR